ncbi:uncharacterized protein G2W53_007771 [Senna tora]|uniref:Uncharacterized protein n=1 Tax=Senna tora TaxID=362788 RepID=A0A834X725_9FABA|nr:uncharacterized protein G2W53_007771 [Senna tora]
MASSPMPSTSQTMHPSSPIASSMSSLLPPPSCSSSSPSPSSSLEACREALKGWWPRDLEGVNVAVVGVSIEGVALPETESEAEDLLSSLPAKSLPFLGNGFSERRHRSIAADSSNWLAEKNGGAIGDEGFTIWGSGRDWG